MNHAPLKSLDRSVNRLRRRSRPRPRAHGATLFFSLDSVVDYEAPPLFPSWRGPIVGWPVREDAGVQVGEEGGSRVEGFLRAHLPAGSRGARMMRTLRQAEVEALPSSCDAIGVEPNLNHCRRVNKYFRAINSRLSPGGVFGGCLEGNHERKRRLYQKHSALFARPCYFLDFLINRVWPKVPLLKKAYFAITKGRSRPISTAEVLGRLVSCGFEIVEHREIDGLTCFAVRKIREADVVSTPTYGIFCALRRVGRGDDLFKVYKLRTMHPYAEFLQDYVYKLNNLREGGKLNNDFRVPTWGRLLRRLWLDELPMVLNLLKGEMKLVGVRPLSPHYFSLYPPEAQELRKRHVPGLLPPFYADLPKTFDEIVASEMKYLRAYEKAPFRTDVRYFFAVMWNIFVKRARSS